MGIVIFKCDTCNREIELVQNKTGLETIGRCIVTDGCRGKLVTVRIIPDHSRGNIPVDVEGLSNWRQRKVLFTHEQKVANSKWKVTHDLNTSPSVQTFVYVPNGPGTTLVEILPTTITVVSSNVVEIEFTQNYTGIAQLISRTSTESVLDPAIVSPTSIIVTTQQKLVLATLDAAPIVTLGAQFLSPTTFKPSILVMLPCSSAANETSGTAWEGVRKVLIGGKIFTIRGISLANIDLSGVVSGSPFYIASISAVGGLVQNKNFILLTKEPFTTFDRDINNYVDVTTVTATNALQGFTYVQPDFYVSDTIREAVYPAIKVAT